jgi:hypothetical protein
MFCPFGLCKVGEADIPCASMYGFVSVFRLFRPVCSLLKAGIRVALFNSS